MYYDMESAYSTIAYPSGTLAAPVNTLSAAKAIAESRNIHTLIILSDLTLTDNLSGYRVTSELRSSSFNPNGFNTDDSVIEKCVVQGVFNSSAGVDLVTCVVSGVSGLAGHIIESSIQGSIQPAPSGNLILDRCHSSVPGLNSPTLDMYSGQPVGVSVRAYSGGLLITNCDHASDVATIELLAGNIRIDSSCTNGILSIRGVGNLTDNSPASGSLVIDTNSFIFGHQTQKTYRNTNLIPATI